jgi:S1-C subfamily serine protease
VRRAAVTVAVAACATALLAGCAGDDENAGPTKVTTTRVQVVEGVGRHGDFNPAAIYRRLSPGVVTVLSLFDGGGSLLEDGGEGGQGSGFVIDGRGYVATNAHVVLQGETGDRDKRAEQVYVEFSDGNRVEARIVGVDPNADVALLKVDPRGLKLTPLALGHSTHIAVGEPVAAIGSPFGEKQSLSIGVISAIDRTIESLTRFTIGNAIQTDAAINPGNSGGPLLDARGRVLGINAQIKTRSGGGEGVGFAIPVDTVRRSLRELRADGRVDYAFLGVTTFTLWPQLADRLDVPAKQGAMVQEIEPGSPAARAGLKPSDRTISFQGQRGVPVGGDVIVAVDDTRLTREQDLADVIGALPAGKTVTLRILRDGKPRTIDVKLAGRETDGSG